MFEMKSYLNKRHLFHFLEIGNGWKPAILNNKEEYNFIRVGQKNFSDSVPYWLGGSADIEPSVALNYSDYITNNSGTRKVM